MLAAGLRLAHHAAARAADLGGFFEARAFGGADGARAFREMSVFEVFFFWDLGNSGRHKRLSILEGADGAWTFRTMSQDV